MRAKDQFLPIDGIVTIYNVTNGGAPGRQPTRLIETRYPAIRFMDRRVSDRRLYFAQQLGQTISRIIRTDNIEVQSGDMARIEGTLYEVQSVQQYFPLTGPTLLDITLEAFTGDVKEAIDDL